MSICGVKGHMVFRRDGEHYIHLGACYLSGYRVGTMEKAVDIGVLTLEEFEIR